MKNKLKKWYKKSSFNFLTKEILLNKYKELEYWSKVAKHFNINEGSLIKIRKLFDIFYINKTDWRCPKTINQNTTPSTIHFRKTITKELLLEIYKKSKNWGQVASHFNVGRNYIIKARKQLGIFEKTKTTGEKYCGINSKLYKGKYKDKYGYISVNRYHPENNKGKTCHEHTLVMEKHLGRLLKSNEIVHHIDGDKSNNLLENLFLCDISTHRKIEAQISRLGYELIKRKIIMFNVDLGVYYINENK